MSKIRFYIKYFYHLCCKYYLQYVCKINIAQELSYFRPNYGDLLNIYRVVIKHKPKKCVEIVGGYSTFVILKALEKNYKKDGIKTELLSIEQNDKYLEIHKEYLKNNINERFLNFLILKKTDLEIKHFQNTEVSVCNKLIINEIDFFYEDRTDHEKVKIAGDALIHQTKSSKNFIIIVDGMLETVKF